MSWTSQELDPERAAGLLAEISPLGQGDLPERVIAWRDREGNLRRLIASYPNEWTITLHFSAPQNGSVEISSWTASTRLISEVIGEAA